MLLHRIHLDPRCREARRDLSDPYQMHSTLCRAFAAPEQKCPEGEFLWRLEPETGSGGCPRVLVQSRSQPDWGRVNIPGWLASADPPIDLSSRLGLDGLRVGQRFRFRLRANPCVTRDGKRLGLLQLPDQEAWVARKGERHGFTIPQLAAPGDQAPAVRRFEVSVSQKQMLRGKQHAGNGIRVYAVLFDGILTVADPEPFRSVLQTGIGHGKAMGLGLLSVAPINE